MRSAVPDIIPRGEGSRSGNKWAVCEGIFWKLLVLVDVFIFLVIRQAVLVLLYFSGYN